MRNMIFMRMLALCLVLTAQAVAAQTPTPDDNDLKSAYCLGVKEQLHASVNRTIASRTEAWRRSSAGLQAAKDSRASQDGMILLRTYLISKFGGLDAPPLALAKKKAELDYAEVSGGHATCTDGCLLKSLQPGKTLLGNEVSVCMETCSNGNVGRERLNACETIDWLPN